MIKVEQRFPYAIPSWEPRLSTVFIPMTSDEDLFDVGMVTAHELGHAFMGHRGRDEVLRELEAWLWAISRRGMTRADREYFWDEIREDAHDKGYTDEDLIRLLSEAEKNVSSRLRR